MGTPTIRLLAALAVLGLRIAPAHAAEDERTRRAREEVEKELEQLVKVPPAQATITWVGLDKPDFELDEARFEMDDERLSYGELSALKPGKVLYQGRISESEHHLKVSLVLHKTKVSLFEGLRTTNFKVSSDVPFPGAKGLAISVRVGLRVDLSQSDPKKQLAMAVTVKPEMLAKVEDAPPPPAIAPPVVRVETASAEPPPQALSQPPPVVRAEEPTPPPVVAVAEPAGQPKGHHEKPSHESHGKEHPLSAVEALKQKILHPPVLVAQAAPVDAGVAPEPVDAGPPDAGPPDAGPPAIDAGPPTPPPVAVAAQPTPPPAEEGSSMAVPIGLGAVALVVGLVLVALQRRKKS